ncbi:hypothetical protein [Roseibium alexandrii]|uniref:hypothetical protein n=1 Tax=Roseibium alexandrii TaxID=388408 RepID=UPI0037523893
MPDTAHQIAEDALSKLNELKVTFNMTRLIMDGAARAEAGEVIKEIEAFIDTRCKALKTAR